MQIIRAEQGGGNGDAGYKAMKQILLLKHGVFAKQYFMLIRSTVAEIQKELDPEGVTRRKQGKLKRRVYYAGGPNESWCYDGHDKLVKYGHYV